MLKKYPVFLLVTWLFLYPASLLHSAEICRALLDCPPDYDGQTVTVGYNTVMLSEIFEHCSPIEVVEADSTPDTISLFIIIDHSSSMSVFDSLSSRYQGACDLIDTIASVSPASEIGIAVFSNKLLHNSGDDPLFKELSNTNGWNDSYVPLTGLSSQVGGMNAVAKLKWAIEVDPAQKDLGNNYLLVNGNYGNSGRYPYNGKTDISIAFEAAKEAFKSSKYAKKRHYVVLFSDGIAQGVDAERVQFINDYIEGKNTPATFTAFFVDQSQPIPNEIKDMTANIKSNGYSSTNILSDVWKTQGEITVFFGKILGSIIGDPLEFTSTPISMTINGVTTTQFDSVDAFYTAPFCAFDKNGELTVTVEYTWHWNNPIDSNQTKNYTVNIKQGPNPDIETVECWEQGRLAFYHNGTEITFARPDQLNLDVRFYPPDTTTAPPFNGSFSVEITNVARTDKLTLPMTKESLGRWYETSFTREYAAPISGDNILQNSMKDSIIAIYQNPDIPLDVVYHAIPSQEKVEMDVLATYYLDQDANGQPDMICAVQQGGQINTAEECEKIKAYMNIPGPRNIDYAESVVPGTYGFDIIINEPEGQPFTGLYYKNDGSIDEQVKIDKVKLASGQTFPYTLVDIQDSMAPVVLSGLYCPCYVKKVGQDVVDTLIVTFAEPVVTPTDKQPFKFYDLDNSSNIIILDLDYLSNKDGAVQTFLVKSVNNSKWYPRNGDSLWINHTAEVYDILRNTQDNENNRKGPLRIKPYQFDILVYVCPNPALPDDLEEVIPIEGLGEDKQGLVIKAKVIGSWTPDVSLNGTTVIFDAVGNSIIQLTGISVDDNKDGIKETVVFIWNGRNHNNRIVGTGSYLAIVSVESDESIKCVQRVMIGIQEDIPLTKD